MDNDLDRLIDRIRRAVRTGRVSRYELARLAAINKSNIDMLSEDHWNPTAATLRALIVALDRLDKEEAPDTRPPNLRLEVA